MHQTFQIVAWSIALILGGLWVLIGGLFSGLGWVFLRQWAASVRWPKLPAKILTGEVRVVSRPKGPEQFQPIIAYAFTDEDRQATQATRIFVGKFYPSEEQARHKVAKYPVGMETTARRNPKDPRESVLGRQGGLSGFLLMVLGLTLMAVPLAAAYGFGLPVWPLIAVLILVAVVALVLDGANRRWLQQARRSGTYPQPGTGQDADVERLVRQGEKMLAIYFYRELHGADLKTSRNQIEILEAHLENKKNS